MNNWPKTWLKRHGHHKMLGLAHIPPDEDGFYDGLVYPASHAKLIWGLAWIGLFPGIYACMRGYYDLAAVPFGVFATSILYWTKPVRYNWRRYVDMTYAGTAFIYQFIRAIGSEYMMFYYMVSCVALCCYPISEYLHTRHSWTAAFFHGGIHLFGSIANAILYSGDITNYI